MYRVMVYNPYTACYWNWMENLATEEAAKEWAESHTAPHSQWYIERM